MQSLPTAAPGAFPGFPATGANPSLSSGCRASELNCSASSNSDNTDESLTGFADLLASTQPADATDTTESDLGTKVTPAEPKKAQGANLLLACFLPTVAQSDVSQNENPLTFELGDSATAPDAQSDNADVATPMFASPSAFRLFSREPRGSIVDVSTEAGDASDQSFSNSQPATPTNASSVAAALDAALKSSPTTTAVTPQDLVSKFEFVASTPSAAAPEAKFAAPDRCALTDFSAEIATDFSTATSAESPQSALPDFEAESTAAKFAPTVSANERPSISARRRSELKFLSTDHSIVTKSHREVGTAIAQSSADHMPTLFKTNLRTEDSFATAPAALATSAGSMVDLPAAESAAAPTAKSAVAQVVAVMDAEAHETTPANMKMDFDFGDARLTVRIEMREGTLRAHFHTDSAALQSSLSREWHVAAATEPEKFVRFAEPSFNSSSAQNSFSGQSQGDTRRDSSQTRDAREEANSFGSIFRHSRSTSRAFAPVAAPASPSMLSLSQLNTFA